MDLKRRRARSLARSGPPFGRIQPVAITHAHTPIVRAARSGGGSKLAERARTELEIIARLLLVKFNYSQSRRPLLFVQLNKQKRKELVTLIILPGESRTMLAKFWRRLRAAECSKLGMCSASDRGQ